MQRRATRGRRRIDEICNFIGERLEPRRLLSAAEALGGPEIDEATAVAVDSTGSSIVAGVFSGTADFQPGSGVKQLTSVGDSDVFIAKYSAAGQLLWVGRIGGGSGEINNKTIAYSQQNVGDVINRIGPQPSGAGEYVNAVKIGPGDTIFVTGSFQGTADFDPGSHTMNLRAGAYQDVFVLKLRPSGSMVWAKRYGGEFND